MRIDEIGWHTVHSADFSNERIHGSGDYVFLLIKTPCRIFADGAMRKYPPYTWVLFTPDSYQQYGADSEEYADDWLHYAPDAEEAALLRNLQIPLNTPVTLPKGTEISKLLREICFTFYSVRMHRAELTDLYFRILFYRLHEQLVRVKAIAAEDTPAVHLREIRTFIFRRPFEHFTAARFADEMNLSETDFLSQYEAENGSKFADDLIHTRMLWIAGQMKEHLSENQTVEEIAQLCGYAIEADFSAKFTRFIGQTPQAYLEHLRQ